VKAAVFFGRFPLATTRIIPMHVIKGQTIEQTVHTRIRYAINPDKTNQGNLVSSFGCDPKSAAAEMLLCKRQYETVSGHCDEKKSDIVLYQIRQSFKPGEVSAENALEIGRELASRFTKDKYQYIVTTHVDHAHIHNHIIFNATAIDGSRKFRNFYGSSLAIRKLSDLICIEQGLSIIEQPTQKHQDYGKWLGNKKPISWRNKLRLTIDDNMEKKPTDFSAFLHLMKAAGYEAKHGKYLAFRTVGQQKFIRLSSLGGNYSEDAIRDAITGKRIHKPINKRPRYGDPSRINLLVDIQAKLKAGKGSGYQQWAKIFNLKQLARTLVYLNENSISDYDRLVEKSVQLKKKQLDLEKQFRSINEELKEKRDLRKQIIIFAKTKNVYDAYRKSRYSQNFYIEHSTNIVLHQASKDSFNNWHGGKLPTTKQLWVQIEKLQLVKTDLSKQLNSLRKEVRDCMNALANVNSVIKNHELLITSSESQYRPQVL
jgi:hypothetical protein